MRKTVVVTMAADLDTRGFWILEALLYVLQKRSLRLPRRVGVDGSKGVSSDAWGHNLPFNACRPVWYIRKPDSIGTESDVTRIARVTKSIRCQKNVHKHRDYHRPHKKVQKAEAAFSNSTIQLH